jgi:hypothetical protein
VTLGPQSFTANHTTVTSCVSIPNYQLHSDVIVWQGLMDISTALLQTCNHSPKPATLRLSKAYIYMLATHLLHTRHQLDGSAGKPLMLCRSQQPAVHCLRPLPFNHCCHPKPCLSYEPVLTLDKVVLASIGACAGHSALRQWMQQQAHKNTPHRHLLTHQPVLRNTAALLPPQPFESKAYCPSAWRCLHVPHDI